MKLRYHVRGIRIFFGALCVTVIASCKQGTGLEHIGQFELRGFTVSVAVSRGTVHAGDSVSVRVVAVNRSGAPVEFSDSRLGCPITVEIRGPGPVNYYRGIRLCEGDGAIHTTVPFDLQPGDSIVGSGWWPGITYVSSSGTVAGKEGPAPAGEYYAVGYVSSGIRIGAKGDSAKIVVQ